VAHPAGVGVLRTLPEEQVNFITTIRPGSPKPEMYLMMGVIGMVGLSCRVGFILDPMA
jgi:hypothetical protein